MLCATMCFFLRHMVMRAINDFLSLCIIFSFLLCSTENAENESMAWCQHVLNESNPCFDELSRHTSYFKRWWIRKRMIVSYDHQVLLKFYWPVNFQDSCKTSRLIDFERPDGCNCWMEGLEFISFLVIGCCDSDSDSEFSIQHKNT